MEVFTGALCSTNIPILLTYLSLLATHFNLVSSYSPAMTTIRQLLCDPNTHQLIEVKSSRDSTTTSRKEAAKKFQPIDITHHYEADDVNEFLGSEEDELDRLRLQQEAYWRPAQLRETIVNEADVRRAFDRHHSLKVALAFHSFPSTLRQLVEPPSTTKYGHDVKIDDCLCVYYTSNNHRRKAYALGLELKTPGVIDVNDWENGYDSPSRLLLSREIRM
jgi:hypothetical protein